MRFKATKLMKKTRASATGEWEKKENLDWTVDADESEILCLNPVLVFFPKQSTTRKKMFSNFNCIFCSRSTFVCCCQLLRCRLQQRQRELFACSYVLNSCIRCYFVEYFQNLFFSCFGCCRRCWWWCRLFCLVGGFSLLIIVYWRARSPNKRMRREHRKSSSPKNYVLSTVSFAFTTARRRSPERETEMRKKCKLFFLSLSWFYYIRLARASISMPNNNDKPHTTSHLIFFSVPKWATQTKKTSGTFCSEHTRVIMFFKKLLFSSSIHMCSTKLLECRSKLCFVVHLHSLNSWIYADTTRKTQRKKKLSEIRYCPTLGVRRWGYSIWCGFCVTLFLRFYFFNFYLCCTWRKWNWLFTKKFHTLPLLC